jgi:hypothetical protein
MYNLEKRKKETPKSKREPREIKEDRAKHAKL